MIPIVRTSLVALLLASSVTAQGQEPAREPTPAQVRIAAEAFDHGSESYRAGDYAAAAEQFERADSNAPSSAALELAVRSREKAGQLDRAANLLALALKRYPVDENLLKLAADVSNRVSRSLFELLVTCNTPCELTVGGRLVRGGPDTRRLLFIAPGTLTVQAGWADDRSEARPVQAEAGGKGQLDFIAPPVVVPAAPAVVDNQPTLPGPVPEAGPPQPERRARGWSPSVFYVGAGLTAVLGGVTVWSGLDTVNSPGAERVRNECGTEGAACSLYQDGLSKQRRTNVLIGATAGVGLLTLFVGVLATDWAHGEHADKNASGSAHAGVEAVAPWATLAGRGGGGLQAVGRF